MASYEYRVLAYARSEIDPVGDDFLIVLRSKEIAGLGLHSILSATWKRFFSSATDPDYEYIEDFIYDLRQQSHSNNGSNPALFQSLDDLSIGPLRTSSSGDFKIMDLASIHHEFGTLLSDVCMCSEEAFDAFVKHLKRADHQLTAASKPG